MKYIEPRPEEEHPNPKHWEEIREKALDRDDHKCRVCGATEDLHAHHVTYDRFGFEELKDITILCKDHHEIITKENTKIKPRQNYTHKSFHEDGSRKEEGAIVKGKMNGLWKIWEYPGEDCEQQITYKKGFKNGPCRKYENGKLSHEYEYHDDTKCGKYTSYYLNGQIKKSFEFEKEKIFGTYEEWHENGTPKCKGKLEASLHQYRTDIRKDPTEYIINIDNNFQMWSSVLKKHISTLQETLSNLKLEGVWKCWDKDKKLLYEGKFKDGLRHGSIRIWDSKLSDYQCVKFHEGKIDDTRKIYYQDGSIASKVKYEEGLENGLYQSWHENGSRYEEGNYINGAKDGIWRKWQTTNPEIINARYHDNWVSGQILKEITYKNGEKNGIYKEWNPLGELMYHELYEKDRNKESISPTFKEIFFHKAPMAAFRKKRGSRK